MIGRNSDPSNTVESPLRRRVYHEREFDDDEASSLIMDDEYDHTTISNRNQRSTPYAPSAVHSVRAYSPLHATPVLPSARTAPYSAPPTKKRDVISLASPNISLPRSSSLRIPYSADQDPARSYNHRYSATPTQQTEDDDVVSDDDNTYDRREEERVNRFSYGAAKYLPSAVSGTPLQSIKISAHQRTSRLSLESPMSQDSIRSLSTTDTRRISMSSHRSSTSMSLLFGEVINLENATRFGSVVSCDSEFAAMDIESCLEGIEIGGGMRSYTPPRQILFPNHSSARTFGFPVQSLSNGFANITRFGRTATNKMAKIASKTVEATQNVLHAYRPPLSPHARSLEDLNFLQQAHKEKVGELTGHSESDEHYDFVLLLKPQEVYRFWAQILDFRAEHLGGEFEAAMEHTIVHCTSTNSTSTRSSDTMSGDDGDSEPLRPHYRYDIETPITGMRRRTTKSPESDDISLPMSPLTRVMMMAGESSVRSPSTRRSQRTSVPTDASKLPRPRQSMFERAVGVPPSPLVGEGSSIKGTPGNSLSGETPMRLRWGNRVQNSTTVNLLSPPVRSLTRGESSMSKARATKADKNKSSAADEGENVDPNVKEKQAEDFPNPVIPRGIAARTNGMLPFLSALRRGFVVRRHRAGKEPVFCKIFSNDGGDTIKYHMVDPDEAMSAFKEQRTRHNRDLTHSSSPTAALRASIAEWASHQEDGNCAHKFDVPDHVAASRYREKAAISKMKKQLLDVATKAANSGVIRAADLVAIHPAFHPDPRNPGVRRGDLGTASLRKSKADYNVGQTFSIVVHATQRHGQSQGNVDNRWKAGEGTEIQFKVLDFETASLGEYWLIFRGFLLLHRDVVVGRFATDRRAGIGGGNRRGEDQPMVDLENILHRDEFLEPATVGIIERAVVLMRNLDQTFMHGAVAPNAVPPPSDYFLGFKSPGTQVRTNGQSNHHRYINVSCLTGASVCRSGVDCV